MNLKALITTFVLGSSSVAMAHPTGAPAVHMHDGHDAARCGTIHPQSGPAYQPAPVYQPVSQPAPVYQPGYYPRPQPAPIYQPRYEQQRWITLGGVNEIVDGPMTFRVGRAGRFGDRFGSERFTKLRLESDGGKSLIQQILIQFSNGRTQVVEVNRYLNASNPTIMIDLDGRARSIAKVTVVGKNARQSAFRVLAI